MIIVSDSYKSYDFGSYTDVGDGTLTMVGQSFTNGGVKLLDSCVVVFNPSAGATGTMVAKLYAHSGTYGTSSVGTGSALATSDALTFSKGAYDYNKFTFSGANRIELAKDTYYIIAVEKTGGSSFIDAVGVLYDGTSPTHGGNMCTYGSSWTAIAGRDLYFIVNGELIGAVSGSKYPIPPFKNAMV